MNFFQKLVFSFLFVINNLAAQTDIDKQLKYADKLFESMQYFDAVTEYKRLHFFKAANNNNSDIYTKIALCYKAGGYYDNAIKYFSQAEKVAASDSVVFQNRIEIIRCNILRKSTSRAVQLCNEIEKDVRFVLKRHEVFYWRGWAYMISDDWENAVKNFAVSEQFKELKLLCEQVINDKVSIPFAKVISYILPGAGQIYSGKIFSGLMSLAWNLAAGYFTINAFISSRAFDGIVIANLVWHRFYKGNLENSENFAVEKNLKIANKALNFLQNEYKGPKP